MYCKRKLGERRRIGWVAGFERGLALLMMCMLVFMGGCSQGEDNQPPEGKNRVVVAIKKPVPKPAPEEKEVAPPVPEKQAEPAVVEEKETSREKKSTMQQEQPKSEAPVPARPAPAEKQATVETLKKPKLPELEEGFVRVRDGESLSAVAARENVFGDFLKWPELYRLNLERLSMIRTWQEAKNKPLPAGLALRFVPPAEEQKGQPPLEPKPWVVTVRSWETPGRLAAPAIKLMRNGYHVYISRAVVKEKQWLRLRVGFYRSKSEALTAKEKIGEILGSNDSWIARAGKTELAEFGKD
jgi:hypothetical protein